MTHNLKYIDELKKEFRDKIIDSVELYPDEIYITVNKDISHKICEYVHKYFAGRLVTAFATDERALDGSFKVYYIFSIKGQFFAIKILLDEKNADYFSITPKIHAAHWYEREIKDMFGLTPIGHPDPRRLILHEDWPEGVYPLRKDFNPPLPPFTKGGMGGFRPGRTGGRYRFMEVEGEGVFEIPVGPVHAGIIEPGHFRFSAVGEAIINLEARLFYTHRGIEKLSENKPCDKVCLIAERICGVCSFSHSTAYCQAVEKIASAKIPDRANYIRTILLELERLYNHIGDVGNICAGTGLGFGSAHGARIKETLMQLNEAVTGNRFLRGINTVGGVRRDISESNKKRILDTLSMVKKDFREFVDILMSSSSHVDRLEATGILSSEIAKDLGVVGPAARASGISKDLRKEHPYAAYNNVTFNVPVYTEGDALARTRIRVDEAFESISIVEQLINSLPESPLRIEIGEIPPYKFALGCVESPRGEDIHWVMTAPGNDIYRYKVRSPSYCNWPAIQFAIKGNIVPDFPLVNKSFELCYSCTDL